MRRKRARQRIVLYTDFLSDWLILCLLIEHERSLSFSPLIKTAIAFPVSCSGVLIKSAEMALSLFFFIYVDDYF
jgi:hypothetical protein